MKNWKRIVGVAVVSAGLVGVAGVSAATLGGDSAEALLCCDVCELQFAICIDNCQGNPACENICERAWRNCAMPQCDPSC